ncbi:MAG: hypothetical protein OXF02_06220 [Simkaniaceae bacterium]|nr:hypothetical protein [Simkaniaceae bacterium]
MTSQLDLAMIPESVPKRSGVDSHVSFSEQGEVARKADKVGR